jgi:hypothetical protein
VLGSPSTGGQTRAGSHRDPDEGTGVVGPHASTTKGGVMKGLAFLMAALLVLATMLAFGVSMA